MDNVNLTFDDEVIDYVVDKAIEYKLGARGLRSIVEMIMIDVMFDIPSEHRDSLNITLDYAREKVEKAFMKAKEILNDNIDVLHELAQTLLSKEKINEKEFRSIIDKYVSRPEKEPYKSEILRKENEKLLNEMENQNSNN